MDDAAFEAAWAQVGDRRSATLALFNEIAEPMKPPRTYPTRRARQWLKRLPKRTWRSLPGVRKPEAVESSTTPADRPTPGVS